MQTIDASGIPQAHSSAFVQCTDQHCTHVHVLLLDENNEPIAQFTLDARFIKRAQDALYAKLAGGEHGEHSGN